MPNAKFDTMAAMEQRFEAALKHSKDRMTIRLGAMMVTALAAMTAIVKFF